MSPFDFLSKLLVEEFGVPLDEITPQATPVALGLDSLSLVELIKELEDEFEIAIPVEATFETLAEAAALVDELTGAKRG